jgi:hypothetical protein
MTIDLTGNGMLAITRDALTALRATPLAAQGAGHAGMHRADEPH